MKIFIKKSVMIFCLILFQIQGQSNDSLFTAFRAGQLKNDFVLTKNMVWHTVKDGSVFIKDHPLQLVLAGTGMALLSTGDDEVQQFFLDHRSKGATGFFNTINHLGHSKNMLAAFGGLYITGWVLKKPKIRLISMEMFTAYGISGLITTSIKRVSGRARPHVGKEQYYFKSINGCKEKYYSFPSGHATISFSTATVLAQHTENKWLKAGIYSAAGAITTGRMYKNQHWFSDVLTGSLIGYITGKITVKVSEKLRKI